MTLRKALSLSGLWAWNRFGGGVGRSLGARIWDRALLALIKGTQRSGGKCQRSIPAFRSLLHRTQTVSFPFNLPAFQRNLILQTCFLSRGEMSAMQTMKIAVRDKGLQAVLAAWPEWKRGTGVRWPWRHWLL